MLYSAFIAVNISGKSKVKLQNKLAKHKNNCSYQPISAGNKNLKLIIFSSQIPIDQEINGFIDHDIEEQTK